MHVVVIKSSVGLGTWLSRVSSSLISAATFFETLAQFILELFEGVKRWPLVEWVILEVVVGESL